MGGKSMKVMRDTTADNENSNAAKASSAQSILSRQNGSPRENQDGGLGVSDPAPKNLLEENACLDTFKSSSNNRQELFLDIIRNKLISDLSSGIFCSNLEKEIIEMEPIQINSERLSVIKEILVQIYLLSDPEKLLLYLKLPNSQNRTADPLTLSLNPLGNRQEIQQAIVWIKTHLEEDEEKSVLKQDVYDQYIRYCQNESMEALSASDFGKVMKQVYPEIRSPSLGTRDCGSVSTEVEGKTEKYKNKSKKTSKSCKISSAIVKDSTPENSKLSHTENLTMGNKVKADSAIEQSFENNLNADSEQDNLSQASLPVSTTTFDDIDCAVGKDLNISPDNVNEAMKNHCTNDKINLDFTDKVELNNDNLNEKRSDETDKSNKVKSTQNLESNESGLDIFLLARLPLWLFKRIIQIAALKRFNNQRTPRFQGGRGTSRAQRLRARRLRLQTQRCRRRRFIPIRPVPVNGGTNEQNIHSVLRNEKNEVPDLFEVEEEVVKYSGHLGDTKWLGVVGETILDEPLKLENIAENVFSGLKNIRGARNQSSSKNNSGTQTPVGNAVHGGLPRMSRRSAEGSAEPTVTLQKQGNIEYDSNQNLLISNTENMVSINTVELNSQNNAVIDSRRENSSVGPSNNYVHFINISPGSTTPLLTSERTPFLSHQDTQTILNNNFLSPNNYSPPNSLILPPNHGFLLSNNVLSGNHNFLPPCNNILPSNNNVLPPNSNLIYNTFIPENNAGLNSFNNTNTGILNGGYNVQNNSIQAGTSQKRVPDISPKNYSANSYLLSAPENSYEISTFYQFSPNEANFNHISMETESPFQSLSEEIDQLLTNLTNFEDPRACATRSQSAPVYSTAGGEFWSPNNEICNDTNNTFDEYAKEQMNRLDSNEYSFEPISDCQTMEPVIENEPFPVLSLDDLAVDSDDITDQMYPRNSLSDPNNINFDNNSLNTPPGRIDENNVFERSFSTENINSFLEASEGQANQTDSLLELEARDIDLFDNLFDDSAENSKDPGKETLTFEMKECTSYHESASDIFLYGDCVNNTVNEHLGFN